MDFQSLFRRGLLSLALAGWLQAQADAEDASPSTARTFQRQVTGGQTRPSSQDERPFVRDGTPRLPTDEISEDLGVLPAQQVAPLAPSEQLRPASPSSGTEGMETARTMLGPPTLASLAGGRGRAQLLSRGRNTAPQMVGDFFGSTSGSQAIVYGNPIDQAAFISSSSLMGGFDQNNANNLVKSNGNFYGLSGGNIVPTGFAFDPPPGAGGNQITTINARGTTYAADGSILSITGLFAVDDKGIPLPGSLQSPLAAMATGQDLSKFPTPLPISVSGGAGIYQFDRNSQVFAIRPALSVALPNPGASGGGLIGRVKLAENTSPMPRDRVFFNYSSFTGVPLTPGDITVNRFTPGFEKTFFDQMASIEMRFPFANTLDSTIVADGFTNTSSTLFGDMSIVGKALLYTDDSLALSAGLQVAIPTANDLHVRLADGTDLVRINNDSVHLMPFVGGLYTPDDRFFAQGFVQVDTPVNGNHVYVNNFNGALDSAGKVSDVTFLYTDLGAGYWIYRNDDAPRLTGFSTTMELHYNRSLGATEVVQSGLYQIGARNTNFEVINYVIGGNMHFGLNSTLSVGYVTPLGNGADRVFNGELRAFFNYRFGPQTFRTRTTL